jgi:hypothetical protein
MDGAANGRNSLDLMVNERILYVCSLTGLGHGEEPSQGKEFRDVRMSGRNLD